MNLLRFRENLFHTINESELNIASLMMKPETDDQLLIELMNGEKYKITIVPTDEFV